MNRFAEAALKAAELPRSQARIYYHVFTNGKDYFSSRLDHSKKQYYRWAGETGVARLYICVMDKGSQEDVYENCLFSTGPFPA